MPGTGVVDLLETSKNEMHRSLRRITSAFCRRSFVLFHECSSETVYMLDARRIFSIVRERYRNFLSLSLSLCFSLPITLSRIIICLCRYQCCIMLRKMMDIMRAIFLVIYLLCTFMKFLSKRFLFITFIISLRFLF